MRDINGRTKLLGLIGQDISYTLSPLIHNRAIQSLGRNEVYLPLDLGEEDLGALLTSFWALGAVGFNVTKPHKEAMARKVAGHQLAAVNTLYRGAQGWCGASTDGVGLDQAAAQLGFGFSVVDHLVILGNGGVVTSLLEYLKGLPRRGTVTILRRSQSRDAFHASLCAAEFRDLTPAELAAAVKKKSGKTLILQASSAPHAGDDLSSFLPALKGYAGALIDLCYGKTSQLLKAAREAGLPCQDGIPMLIEQARASQVLWWGEAAASGLLEDAVRHHLLGLGP